MGGKIIQDINNGKGFYFFKLNEQIYYLMSTYNLKNALLQNFVISMYTIHTKTKIKAHKNMNASNTFISKKMRKKVNNSYL